MRKFKYSMESILQINIKLEDQAKINYSNARYRLTMEEEKLAALHIRRETYESQLRQLRKSILDVLKIQECEQAIDIINNRIENQSKIVRNAENRLEVARIRLNSAIMERKIHDKLKENAWEEYMLEYEAEEQKEIDELNSFNFSDVKLTKEDR